MSEVEKIVFRDREVAARARFGDVSVPRAAIGGGVKAPGAGATMLVTIALTLFALSSAHGSLASFPFAVAAIIMLALLIGRAGIVGQNLCAVVLERSAFGSIRLSVIAS